MADIAADFPDRPQSAGAGTTLAIICAVLSAFFASVALPLATYTTALALFGLAHVLFELRYVAWRFHARLRHHFLLSITALITIAVASRLAAQLHMVSVQTGTIIELACGGLLALLPIAVMNSRRLAGFLLALPFAAGAVLAPFETLLALAILHNLTPIAFLGDLLEGPAKHKALICGAGLFVGVPLLIASGLPWVALYAVGLTAPDASLFRAGSLEDNLGAYIPQRFAGHDRAFDVFSAAVFAQCLHYLATIWLLPKLMSERQRPRIPGAKPATPRWPVFAAAAVGSSLILIGLYAFDYGLARKFYSLAALIHAWLEIPILILALDRTTLPVLTAKPEKESDPCELPASA